MTASSRDMLVRILCFDDGHRRVLHDLKLTVSRKIIREQIEFSFHLGDLFVEYIEYEEE